MPKVIAGIEMETVIDMIGDSEFIEAASALVMPRLETTMEEPPCGIHFGMSDEIYHRIPAFSKSHLLNLLTSPTIWWSESWLNPTRKERDGDALTVGRAYHAMILEGIGVYESRFYPKPDPAAYPKALRTADEVKQALAARDQKPVTRIEIPEQEGKTRPAVKADWVAQLVAYDRSAEVWDDIMDRATQIAAGRALLSVEDDQRIRIAAHMISLDKTLASAFSKGFPEVTLIWRDPHQGVLCKCRIDYLKLRAIIELKSFANRRGRSVRRAIMYAIAEERYFLQPAVYLQGATEVRKLVRQNGPSAIFHHHPGAEDADENPEMMARCTAEREFALKWAAINDEDRWLWLWQQKGAAPVTRGLWHPINSLMHSQAQRLFLEGLRQFRRLAETYGTDPWLDIAEVEDLDETDVPLWGLEI